MRLSAAGCAQSWWWDRIDRLDLYSHFAALREFVNGIDFAAEPFQPIDAIAIVPRPNHHAPPALRVVGLQGSRHILLWVQNRQSTWANADRGREPRTLAGAVIRVHDVPAGHYRADWWNTYDGRAVSTEEVTATQRTLKLRPPPTARDIACKLIRLTDVETEAADATDRADH